MNTSRSKRGQRLATAAGAAAIALTVWGCSHKDPLETASPDASAGAGNAVPAPTRVKNMPGPAGPSGGGANPSAPQGRGAQVFPPAGQSH